MNSSHRSSSTSLPPVFIGGAGRSGTTLLRVMLNAHPKLCAGPEFKLTPLIADLYNQTIGRKDILSAYSLDENDINRQYASFIGAFFEKFRMQNNADRVIEKTPHNVLIMKELGSIYPEAKFIHVVRDGRDVACSLNKMAWVDAYGKPVWYVQNVESAATYWVQVVTKGLKDGEEAGLKDRIKLIKYEDLIMHPEKVLKNTLAFIGEPWDETVLNYTETQRTYEPKESSTDQVSQKLYHQSVGRWKMELSSTDLQTVHAIAGDLLKHLGYEGV